MKNYKSRHVRIHDCFENVRWRNPSRVVKMSQVVTYLLQGLFEEPDMILTELSDKNPLKVKNMQVFVLSKPVLDKVSHFFEIW